jgi:hypothetical protein
VVKWTYQDGQTVDSTSQPVAPTDAANPVSVTEFHVSKPSPWPAGTYTVEILLNGMSAGTRSITIR